MMSGGNRSRMRRIVWKRDNYICQYCGKDLNGCMLDEKRRLPFSEITVDHVIPKSKGGKWKLNNLVTSCESCNSRKGAMTQEEILQLSFKQSKLIE